MKKLQSGEKQSRSRRRAKLLREGAGGRPACLRDIASRPRIVVPRAISRAVLAGAGNLHASLRKNHSLPKLVEKENLRGTFHCHTTASDGHNSIEEMAEAAQALGFEYLGIADHSHSSIQAH